MAPKNETRQLVRYLFFKLDPAWRRQPVDRQVDGKLELAETIRGFQARSLLRSYSTMGTRGECDFMLWQAAEELETLQALETAIFSTRMGAYLSTPYSFLAMTKRSIYEFPEELGGEERITVAPQDSKYLFLYPFVKTRAWYKLSKEQRQEMMNEHVRMGRNYPEIRINTAYSFGLDDQEFMVGFEGDDPGDFLDLVMELRESDASAYTERDTPIFTCIQMSLWDVLDSLGGASVAERARLAERDAEGFVAAATTGEIPPGGSKRVYNGADAIALFNVDGTYYAVSDRCTHGRASLSEGTVDGDGCVLNCPWHGGKFDLRSGEPAGGPVRVPVKTYRVKVEGDRILVG
ncbi:MAG: Rieske 2Fe-2S domain-containing protein [Gemmatimonadetes bacterium]|uniref:Rieske 2Fe-2S domain-containing protein n=1 Tax=Candidatus Kutchimonas denitrificans TaxID=3056748 RepID=A0AAE4ZBZ0_9BACT|nr:Rieske 2Fe-2S domain-containing protein [Gemmatimonadota bacterium]NIR76467.1 Rieske 2Fe-2S domain-containing protein [Candidatus Kutchimonas denitrificans]NIS03285.1 Rieske 2Fe-2S domain-containing protein [Gemmatimonadota bacterium]NIT69146.1 Rieske 2Fe-2S domain-containing protein [Gemmatimonadota bacterium]NIU54538.1 Rieske 2Fe-2S domain-containing protein [Gemmatimonadota bacterium]